MVIKRRIRPRLRRIVSGILLSGAVLWLVAVTASSATAESALRELSRQNTLALSLLRRQLGDREEEIPVSLSLMLGQSPALLASRETVLELRRTVEPDDSSPLPSHQEEPPDIPETPDEPETPLLFIDNGVPARTLIPTSSEGYIVTGDVCINNRSDHTFDETLFDGTFAAALSDTGEPQVLILHTHGSEAYTMPAGQDYTASGECRTTDNSCNVTRVGEELKAVLEEAGICVLHDTTLHDYPEYSGAYGRSLAAAEDYLEQYPSIAFVLDIHRDAIYDTEGNPYKVVSPVAGVNTAQMSFVIGTDGGGLDHPYWQDNLRLAAAVQQALAEKYPTLMRPITVRNSRYNQHLTPGCLLVEMGAAGNSLEEALLSARLLGEALAEVLGRGQE